jgi:hypothetical protein
MSNFSTEVNSHDEIARQQLVLEKEALLAQQQQRATRSNRQAYSRQTQESIILELVIPQFVGASEYCFLAGVSRGWRAQQLGLSFVEARSERRTKDKLRTAYRAAFTTAARLQWALDSKLSVFAVRDDLSALQLVNLVQEVAVDARAEVLVLNRAQAAGSRWRESICAEAARAGDLRTLLWAREQSCVWTLGEILDSAAQGGHMNVLLWLHSNSERPWTNDERIACCLLLVSAAISQQPSGFVIMVQNGQTGFMTYGH